MSTGQAKKITQALVTQLRDKLIEEMKVADGESVHEIAKLFRDGSIALGTLKSPSWGEKKRAEQRIWDALAARGIVCAPAQEGEVDRDERS